MAIDWFPLWLSLRVAVLATALALPGGLWLAYCLSWKQFRGKQLLEAALTVLPALPPTVLGYYLLVLLSRSSPLGRLYEAVTGSPLLFSWQAAVVAALVSSVPLVAQAARAALEALDARFGPPARSLGASQRRVFWRVLLPLALGPLLAAGALAFARVLGEFATTLMIAGNIPGKTQTLAAAVYEAAASNNAVRAGVLALAISGILVAVVWSATRAAPRQSRP